MCGIAGFVDLGRGVDDPSSTLASMARALAHRGPDDEGVAFDDATRVGFAFRRLAVVGLGEQGRQPMRSRGGRFEIVFNGEVYDHAELRAQLSVGTDGFRGSSDTETLLAAFEAWGVAATLPRCSGMFAMAVLDRAERALWLARDRFGVKPLVCAWAGGGRTLAFASEVKALRAVPGMRLSVDRDALAVFLERGYSAGSHGIHPEVRRVAPGTLLRVDLATGAVEERVWWSTIEAMRSARERPFEGGDADAIDAVDRALLRSVRLRMLAEVPVGALLSGGIDSSAVVAAMQAVSSRPVETFTVGFDDPGFDESAHARAIAAHLGTRHHEVRVTDREALELVRRLPQMWDEPFGDSSQIPTALVCAVARRDVTVALSGDGGDELFAGYYRHGWIPRLARRSARVPQPARRAMAAVLRGMPRGLIELIGRGMSVDRAGDRVRKLARALGHGDGLAMYREMLASNPRADRLVLGSLREALDAPVATAGPAFPPGLLDRILEADMTGYLPDDILVKVDRASMAFGLEAREPMLDHALAELAFRLPHSMKIRGGERKWVLRRVLERRVPRGLFERPKQGFAVPLARWLRGPLREWAEDLLSEDRIRRAGYLDAAGVRAVWSETLDPRSGSDGAAAWSLLMFEAWRDRWGH